MPDVTLDNKNMNDKVSKYNIEVEHTDCMLLYSALRDKLLPIGFKEYAAIETLMEHLPVFLVAHRCG